MALVKVVHHSFAPGVVAATSWYNQRAPMHPYDSQTCPSLQSGAGIHWFELLVGGVNVHIHTYCSHSHLNSHLITRL